MCSINTASPCWQPPAKETPLYIFPDIVSFIKQFKVLWALGSC